MTNLAIQERIQAYAGMSVETVKAQGSEGQKLMVSLFDKNQDGKLDKQEAEHFNNYRFKTEEGRIKMTDINDGSELELIYDNFEEDVLHTYNGKPLNRLHHYLFKNKAGEGCYFAKLTGAVKTVIDMVNGKVSVEGAKPSGIGSVSSLWGNNIELTVKNSDVEEIHIKNGSLKLENTKDKGLIFDSAVKVETDGKSTIKADKESDYDIK